MEKTIIEAIQTAALRLTNAPRKQGFSLDPRHGGAIHHYTDRDGAITFARLRLKHPDTGEKWIRPLRRDNSGIWCELKAPEFEGGAPLYNLHRLCDPARQSERVILVEGEYKVDMLALRGILATTSGGAQSVEAADWPPMAGRDVLAWPEDNAAFSIPGYSPAIYQQMLILLLAYCTTSGVHTNSGGFVALTDLEVKKANKTSKPEKRADDGGLFLLVQSNGAKYWRLAYRLAGKQKTLALGVYPDVGLSDARERREAARKVSANGADPSAVKKAQKATVMELAANSFEIVAREWLSKFSKNWKESHTKTIKVRLVNVEWLAVPSGKYRHILQPDETGAPLTHLSHPPHGRSAPSVGRRSSRRQRACRQTHATRTPEDTR